MLKLSLHENSVEEIITRALQVLKKGGIVAYPTESFYGLGVTANIESAVKRLYLLKKRPLDKPVPVIVGNNDVLMSIVKSVPLQAEKLMNKFWPGPLNIIFDSKHNLPVVLTGGREKVAVRIPGSSFALALARASDFPITATSANLSGRPPAQEPEEVANYFGDDIDLIVDCGKAPGGTPSTIIDATVTPARVLREGSVSILLL